MRPHIIGAPLPHLSAWRRHRLLSQQQLAIMAGLAPRCVRRIEAGSNARFDTIQSLAKALKLSPATLTRSAPPASVYAA